MITLMRPYIWRCRMWNGADFEVSTFFRLARDKGRHALLKLANGDYPEKDGVVVYESRDIERMWEARS